MVNWNECARCSRCTLCAMRDAILIYALNCWPCGRLYCRYREMWNWKMDWMSFGVCRATTAKQTDASTHTAHTQRGDFDCLLLLLSLSALLWHANARTCCHGLHTFPAMLQWHQSHIQSTETRSQSNRYHKKKYKTTHYLRVCKYIFCFPISCLFVLHFFFVSPRST